MDFFDVDGLSDRIVAALAPETDRLNDQIRAAARDTVASRYDVNTVSLPAYLDLLRSLLPASKPL